MFKLPANRSHSDRLLVMLSQSSLMLVVGSFLFLFTYIAFNGFSQLSLDFIWQNPIDAGRSGGIASVLVSTFLILLCCLVIVLPVGLSCALIMHFNRHQQSAFWRCMRTSLDVLASAPSIVFGLFGNALFSIYLGMGFSILSGGLTLACMVLPFFVRSCEAAFNALPARLHIQSGALGIGLFTYSWRILIPVALPGIIVALFIATGRALAETAALVFTAGYVLRMPESLLDSGRSLSVHILDLALNVPGGNNAAYASALILMLLLLFVNLLVYYSSRRLVPGGSLKNETC